MACWRGRCDAGACYEHWPPGLLCWNGTNGSCEGSGRDASAVAGIRKGTTPH